MKKIWKIIGLTALGVVVVLAGLFVWLGWSWSPKEIVSVADHFHPGKDWKLTSETITPPRNLCIDSVCPQVVRDWDIPKSLKNKQEFIDIAKLADTQLYTNDDCMSLEQILEKRESCVAKGYSKQYYVRVEYRKEDYVTRKPHITLIVVEEKDEF